MIFHRFLYVSQAGYHGTMGIRSECWVAGMVPVGCTGGETPRLHGLLSPPPFLPLLLQALKKSPWQPEEWHQKWDLLSLNLW